MSYKRHLGTFDACMIVVGAVIGGGIFMNPPGVARAAGSAPVALGMWILGGLITIGGAFCFAELGARLPHAGGSYVYLREGYGRPAAFIQGWALLVVSGAGAVAAVSMVCANFLAQTIGAPESAHQLLAVLAIAGLTVLNCVGVRPGANTQNVLTTLKMALVLTVIAAGVKAAGMLPPAAVPGATPAAAPVPFSLLALLGSLVPVIFAYNGWQVIGMVAGEIDDAPRRLPRALVGSILIVMALYLGVNVAYIEGLGFSGLAASMFPGSALMEKAFGSLGNRVMQIGTVISTLGFLNVAIITVPRAFQAMAADGLFFDAFREVHPRFHTPWKAVVLQSTWAIVLVFSGKYEQLLAYNTIADGLFMGLAAAALFALRARETPEQLALVPFRCPGYPVLPAVYVLASVGIMISAVALSWRHSLAGLALIVAGLPVYLVWERQAIANARLRTVAKDVGAV